MASAEEDSHKVPRSRLEVNFLRVFQETQKMASGIKTKDWTFKKQVEWLEQKLPEMEKSPCPPCADTQKTYRRRVEQLRGVMAADEKASATETALPATAKDTASKDTTNSSNGSSSLLGSGTTHGTTHHHHNSSGANVMQDDAGTESAVLTQQIHHRTEAQTTARLRKQLLAGGTSDAIPGDVDERLSVDERRRDRLLDDMLAMTSQWKEQSRVAGDIIKKDIETLDKSGGVADTNQSRLKTESDRLSEFNKRACNCWIWLMLLLVCCIFISMVLFIKLFPKAIVAAT